MATVILLLSIKVQTEESSSVKGPVQVVRNHVDKSGWYCCYHIEHKLNGACFNVHSLYDEKDVQYSRQTSVGHG